MAQIDEDTREMLEQAVYQQLFNNQNPNQIMGKNPDNRMQITGVDELLEVFIQDLNSNLQLLRDLKFKEFLVIFEKRFGISLDPTLKRIQNNVEGMGGLDIAREQITIIIYIVLTKLLEELREKGYQKWGLGQLKSKFTKQSNKDFGLQAKNNLQKLAALNEENISLLYNLSFLLLIAINYKQQNIEKTLKRLISLRINRILQKI